MLQALIDAAAHFICLLLYGHGCHEEVHNDKVTGTAQHNENMKDFVGAKVLVVGIEKRKLQSIDDAADGVDDTARQKPSKSRSGERVEDGNKGQNTQPSHSDIEHGGYPFGTGDPKCLQKDSADGNCPHGGTQGVAKSASQNDETDGCVAASDHNGYHHMVHFAQPPIHFLSGINRMVDCAGSI